MRRARADGHRARFHSLGWLLALLAVLAVAPFADAQPNATPMLHEFLPPDAEEDVDLSATTAGGRLPAALRTPSGTVQPPDVTREPKGRQVYREPATDAPAFRPDRDTRRPDMENYDDPFAPSLTPFKRLHAYDSVGPDYSVRVGGAQGDRPAAYRPIVPSLDPGEHRRGEERFFGDMSVELIAGEYVRIPTVGPDARLVRLLVTPSTDAKIWRDGADNWFARANYTGRVRFVSEIAILRDTFGSPFAEVRWDDLPRVPRLPPVPLAAAQRVAHALGVSRALPPKELVSRLVTYFRSFEPSTVPPNEHGDIYLDLALSRKGVCRHRAFAFLVTALGLGLPTRLVVNEAHAWVEVNDGTIWHRIDLGGAANDLQQEHHPDRPPHVPPPDPYAWPAGKDSGEQLADRSRSAALASMAAKQEQSAPNGEPAEPARTVPQPAATSSSADVPGAHSIPTLDRPSSQVEIGSVDHDVFRGLPLHLQGTVRADGAPCVGLRVDVQLLIGDARTIREVGALSTDGNGLFDGAVILPRDVPIGDHELLVATPGNAVCGPGQSH